jgi:uncharacterized membrane protein YphA (DoxX/SURF4 family)
MFHLVTPFPFLLDFSFFAPLLLRLTLGIYMLSIGFTVAKGEVKPEGEPQPKLSAGEMIYRALFIIAGVSLIIGLYLQISALLATLLMLGAIIDKRARIFPELSRGEYILLLIIAFSLMVTGAGPFAFDLPL